MPVADALMRTVCAYATLEQALQEAQEQDYMNDPPESPGDVEAWIINLQNCLLWGYQTGVDEDQDVVVLEAITATAKKLGLGPYDITGPVRRILDELTLV